MRPAGYDTNGNCEFAIPLSAEFSNKDECVKIINKYIDLCLEELIIQKYNPFVIENIKEIREKIPNFYHINNTSFIEAYVIHNNGVCFCLKRYTNVNGWKHSIDFYSYDEMNYLLNSNPSYTLIISKYISDDEKYAVEHNFDQEITNKSNNRNKEGLLVIGSTDYVKIKKQNVSQQTSEKHSEKPSAPTSQHSQQTQTNVNVNQNNNNQKQRKIINFRYGRPLIIEI